MPVKKTVNDYLHEHPELVNKETKDFLVRLGKTRRKRITDLRDTMNELARFADSLGMSADAPERRNFVVLRDWVLHNFRIAFERASAIKELGLGQGVEVMYIDKTMVISHIQKDFMLVFEGGGSLSPIVFMHPHVKSMPESAKGG